MARLAVARLWFCSNSFTPLRTRAADVVTLENTTDITTGSELDGVNRFIATRPDWRLSVLRSTSAAPGGPLSADVFGAWMASIEDGLRKNRFDGVYLILHGACQAEGDPSADLTILRRVRAIMGQTPIVATFDVRANLSEETVILLDGASTRRQWPDGGGADAAIRALTMLEGILAGSCRPVGALARLPIMLPDHFLHEAMQDIWSNQLTALPDTVLDASVHFGFAWGDSPYAGPSALVWSNRDAGLARSTAARLAIALVRWRSRVAPALLSLEAGLAKALASATSDHRVMLLDLGDDPASGGLADTPGLLHAALSCQGAIAGRLGIAVLHDPDTIRAAFAAGIGGHLERSLAARMTKLYGPGVTARLDVITLAETAAAGRTALLQTGKIDILVCERRPHRITPEFLRDAGMIAQNYQVLALKCGEAARIEFAEMATDIVACSSLGPANPDLMRLPFHYVPANRRMINSAPISSSPGAEAAAAASAASGTSDQPGAQQPYQRHEERRANPQQKRAETFGAQGG